MSKKQKCKREELEKITIDEVIKWSLLIEAVNLIEEHTEMKNRKQHSRAHLNEKAIRNYIDEKLEMRRDHLLKEINS